MYAISNKLFEAGGSFTWQWLRTAEVVASIRVRSEGDALRLAYSAAVP